MNNKYQNKLVEVCSNEEAFRNLGIASNLVPNQNYKELIEQGYTIFRFSEDDWKKRKIDLGVLTNKIEKLIQYEGTKGGRESNKYYTSGPKKGLVASKNEHVEPNAQRLSNLIDKDEIFLNLALLPEILLCSNSVIKREMRLSSLDMREPLMGCNDQVIHADVPSDNRIHHPSEFQCVSFLYLDDATAENGPTRVFPGSHMNSSSEANLKNEVKILAPRGSLVVMNANLKHGGTKKKLDSRRRVVFINYRDRRFRPQLNTKLFLNKKTIANLSEAKKFLLGVRKTDPTKLLQTWAYYNRHEWYTKILIQLKILFLQLVK